MHGGSFLFLKYLAFQLVLTGVFLLLERLRPAETSQPRENLVFNLRWTVFMAFVVRFLPLSFVPSLAAFLHARLGTGWIELPSSGGLAAEALQWFVMVFFVDFFFVCIHRLEHSRWLWFTHAAHHAETSLNAAAAEINHWIEGGTAWGLGLVLTQTIFHFHLRHEGLLYSFMLGWHLFTHMNLGVDFGRLNYVLTTPQYHRIHHSRLERHLDLCFAGFFPVIDLLFGTFYLPALGEFPPTGDPAVVEGRTLLSANLDPFRILGRQILTALPQGLANRLGHKRAGEVLPPLRA
jgi:sterol desaturase/sphingolipid hydroxylase (fatty acid hydroxylase superfamily)